jgi:tetratricopeptide (TPR) repeat protein
MKLPAASDVRRWTDQLARDPASLSFIHLARACRIYGRHEAALKLCQNGVQRNPSSVPGHILLARLYFDAGQQNQAAAVWSRLLELNPSSFEARRGLGFCALASRDWPEAWRQLTAAASLRPADRAVAEALSLLEQIRSPDSTRPLPPVQTTRTPELVEGTAPRPAGPAGGGLEAVDRVPAASQPEPEPVEVVAESEPVEPSRLFEPMSTEAPFLGALLLDERGVVLAGKLGRDSSRVDRAAELAATFGPVIREAWRCAGHLELGAWRALTVEAGPECLHLTPASGGRALLLAASRNTSADWLVRAADRGQELASRYLEVSA